MMLLVRPFPNESAGQSLTLFPLRVATCAVMGSRRDLMSREEPSAKVSCVAAVMRACTAVISASHDSVSCAGTTTAMQGDEREALRRAGTITRDARQAAPPERAPRQPPAPAPPRRAATYRASPAGARWKCAPAVRSLDVFDKNSIHSNRWET